MMETLLHTNELVLFGRIDEISPLQIEPVLDLLRNQYNAEIVGYPRTVPPFAETAAAWSAKTLFYAAQLLMYREHRADSLPDFFPPFGELKSAAAILSADLSLRYLPSILLQLEHIDVEDPLIPILKEVLKEWHYSGLLAKTDLGVPVFDEAFDDTCLLQLYVDRVIARKKKKIGQMDKIRPLVLSALGDYEKVFWKDFNSTL